MSSCYRLTFWNKQTYFVDVSSAADIPGARGVFQAILYRASAERRDTMPMLKSDGTPITIYAASEGAALAIANDVLCDVCGSSVESIIRESGHHAMPSA
jgi:hypothetical protein